MKIVRSCEAFKEHSMKTTGSVEQKIGFFTMHCH